MLDDRVMFGLNILSLHPTSKRSVSEVNKRKESLRFVDWSYLFFALVFVPLVWREQLGCSRRTTATTRDNHGGREKE